MRYAIRCNTTRLTVDERFKCVAEDWLAGSNLVRSSLIIRNGDEFMLLHRLEARLGAFERELLQQFGVRKLAVDVSDDSVV